MPSEGPTPAASHARTTSAEQERATPSCVPLGSCAAPAPADQQEDAEQGSEGLHLEVAGEPEAFFSQQRELEEEVPEDFLGLGFTLG